MLLRVFGKTEISDFDVRLSSPRAEQLRQLAFQAAKDAALDRRDGSGNHNVVLA